MFFSVYRYLCVCYPLPLVQNLEKAANRQKVEIKHLTDQLVTLKQQAGADREALKRAARAQKQRAECSEDTAGHLSIQLLDMVRPSTAQTYQSIKTFNVMDIKLVLLFFILCHFCQLYSVQFDFVI